MTPLYYLIGYMGAGKSTVGQLIAQQLHYGFIDTDRLVEEEQGLRCEAVIRTQGLAAFHQHETHLLQQLCDPARFQQPQVIATGGALPCKAQNWQHIQRTGRSIYLRWSAEHLTERLLLTDRNLRPTITHLTPSELHDFVAQQLAEREPYYAAADYTIDAPLGELGADNDAAIARYIIQHIIPKQL